MSHPPNGSKLQTTIPLLPARYAPVTSPLIRAGKIIIYANLGLSQIIFCFWNFKILFSKRLLFFGPFSKQSS